MTSAANEAYVLEIIRDLREMAARLEQRLREQEVHREQMQMVTERRAQDDDDNNNR